MGRLIDADELGNMTFTTDHARRICCSDECSRINGNKLTAERKARTKTKNSDIVDIAVKAKKLGMSYGQYSALLEMNKVVEG